MSELNTIAIALKDSQCDASGIHKNLKEILGRPVRHKLSPTEVAEAKKLKLMAKDIKDGIIPRSR